MVCRTVTQVQGVCLTGLVGDLWNWTRWSLRNESQIFRACGSYGEMACLWGSGVAYGKMAGLWGSIKPCGKCVRRVAVWENRDTVWGDGLCVGGRRIAWGSRENVWEMPRDMGTYAGTWGGRQAAWGAKIALKPGIWERWRPADFACFYEFLAGGGGPAFATVKASHRACCECRGA